MTKRLARIADAKGLRTVVVSTAPSAPVEETSASAETAPATASAARRSVGAPRQGTSTATTSNSATKGARRAAAPLVGAPECERVVSDMAAESKNNRAPDGHTPLPVCSRSRGARLLSPPAMIATVHLAQTSPLLTTAAVVAALAAAAAAWLVWRVAKLLQRASQQQAEQQSVLAELLARAKRLEEARGDLDQRRTEHVLIDIRDRFAGLEDALLAAVARPVVVERGSEAAAAPAAPAQPTAEPADLVVERVQNRLAALGYERVLLIGERDLFEMAAVGRTEIPIEARRGGVVHKGRCIVEKGRVLDVRLDPPYALFP